MLLALFFGYPLPFAAVQILWNNVVTEGTITVNLMMEPREGDEMQNPPIPRGEPILTRALLGRMLLMGAVIAGLTLEYYALRLAQGVPFERARTETSTLLAVCEWFNVLNCRSARRSAFGAGALRNRWLVGGLLLSNLLQMAVVFAPPLNRRCIALVPGGGHDEIAPRGGRRQHAVIGEQVLARMGDERGEALEEDERLEDDVGCAVAPGVAELEQHAAALVQGEALVGESGTTYVSREMLEPLAVVSRHAHSCVQ